MQTLGQSCKLINLNGPLDLYEKIYICASMLTFLFEVVDIVLCDDKGTVLRPIVLVNLHYLAAHHNYFETS